MNHTRDTPPPRQLTTPFTMFDMCIVGSKIRHMLLMSAALVCHLLAQDP